MEVWRKDGLPREVPLLITEVNVSWQSSERFVDVWGGLWLADYLGAFLAAGGAGSYFFHYLPWRLGQDCKNQWGTFSLQRADASFQRFERVAQYYASQLITQTWVAPGEAVHAVHPAASDVTDDARHLVVTAYAVRLPDGRWSLMLINKDRDKPHSVEVVFRDQAAGRALAFRGAVEVTSWGAEQYVWQPNGRDGAAKPSDPPRTDRQSGNHFSLPRASITILRGRIAPAL
jgi:hypothetical protein